MNFQTKYFKKDDQYYTSFETWKLIEPFISKNFTLWECFYSENSKSAIFLRQLGYDVISEKVDFYKHNLGNIIVSNPPFSDLKNIMKRLYEIVKCFIIIVPISKLCCKYMSPFKGKLQIIIPKKRINFIKCDLNGDIIKQKNSCNFDSIFLCYQMKLSSDIIFL
jgi:hypothetical protein